MKTASKGKKAVAAALREGYGDAAAPGVAPNQMPAQAKKPSKAALAKALRSCAL